MASKQWFYHTDQDWDRIWQKLKQTSCPHCNLVGTLIRHGSLQGYDDSKPQRKCIRARRIFCSNRHNRNGCGRTFSVFKADKIKRRSLSTRSLGRFLKLAVAGGIGAAVRAARSYLSDRTLQRIWKRFTLAQSKIRTNLLGRCPPPEVPASSSHAPEAEVLVHLQAAFPDADCPIAAFQVATQTCFL